MIYIYYHVLLIPDYKSKIRSYFDQAKKFGLILIVQKKDQPEYFMEIISSNSSVGEQLKGLSDLRASMGIDQLLLNRKIHVEVFDDIIDVREDGTNE